MEIFGGFTALQIGVALAAALGSAFVRGLTGFGMAILLVPVLALALPPVEAVVLTNALSLMIGATEIRSLVRDAEPTAWGIGAAVVLATPLGLWALAMTGTDVARLVIALIALSAFVAILLPKRGAAVPGRLVTGSVGVLSGLMTGYAGMPGPPVVPYYAGRDLPRPTIKASMQLIFTIAACAGTASATWLGILRPELLLFALVMLPMIIAGNRLGARVSGRVSDLRVAGDGGSHPRRGSSGGLCAPDLGEPARREHLTAARCAQHQCKGIGPRHLELIGPNGHLRCAALPVGDLAFGAQDIGVADLAPTILAAADADHHFAGDGDQHELALTRAGAGEADRVAARVALLGPDRRIARAAIAFDPGDDILAARSDCAEPAIDHDLRRIDPVAPGQSATGVILLQRRVILARQGVLPAEPVPVGHRPGDHHQIGVGRELLRQPVRRGQEEQP